MKTFKTMLQTELKLSLRGMDMFIFAICLPLTVLVILGVLDGGGLAMPGSLLAQSFGALTTISICAGGVMGLPLVVSDYRGKKILKRFQVTPVRPSMLLAVQVVIYTLYALVSLALLYAVAALLFGYRMQGSMLHFLGGYALVLISMFSIGLMVGGIAPNSKTAGMIASILYFPMLIFSGATLPYEVMPRVLQRAADILPLTQGIKILKAASLGHSVDHLIAPISIMGILAVVCIAVSVRFFRWE